MKPRSGGRVAISPRKLGAKTGEGERFMNGSGPPLVRASVKLRKVMDGYIYIFWSTALIILKKAHNPNMLHLRQALRINLDKEPNRKIINTSVLWAASSKLRNAVFLPISQEGSNSKWVWAQVCHSAIPPYPVSQ